MTRISPIAPEAGFTLIEMLVVLSLIALVAAFALPRVASDPANSRPAQIAAIEAVIDKARDQAVQSGRPVAIDPAALGTNVAFAPAIGQVSDLRFYADGSSNGGTLRVGARSLVTIDWLSGQVRHAE